MRRIAAGLIALTLGLSACAGLPAPAATSPAAASSVFAPDLAAMSDAELTAFTRAMPKGGDLHIHLGGAPFGERLIEWAAEDGLCVDLTALALTPTCQSGADTVLASALTPVQRSDLLDSLSTRRPDFAGRSGRDQFFTAFDRFRATLPARRGDTLADLMRTLAAQNTWYVEVMSTPQTGPARALAETVGWTGDMAALQAAIAPSVPALVQVARADIDAMEARARSLMSCDRPAAEPGCAVTVRYLVQTNRLIPPEQTFAQVQVGVALIADDPRWVGLQLVAPEDHPSALANYRIHMALLAFLTDSGRGAPLALHAGELTLGHATPADLSFHITEAIRAGARRIGHGVAIPHEDAAADLVAAMARDGIAVEINLTSNAAILGVSGQRHPVGWLRAAGVPVILSTDDPGILRIDLSHEYARAVRETDATYADLVASARSAITHSFLSPVDKARELARFEARLAAFEATESRRRR